VQQNYWKNNKWRFTGVVGGADLRLSLLAPEESIAGTNVDWRTNGKFLFAKIARRIKGNWYGGVLTRLVDASQSIESDLTGFEFDTGSDITSVQSYSAAYRSFHSLIDSVVLAWEIQGCNRGGTAPLWDACTVKLRGFSATDYLGRVSGSGQIEARWQLSERWGMVSFAGAGYVGSSFNGIREREAIPSYGAGVRFTVLKAKRINLRLDYARSTDSDAVHISVG